jgi:endonuclease YncB( thermonuclease family)
MCLLFRAMARLIPGACATAFAMAEEQRPPIRDVTPSGVVRALRSGELLESIPPEATWFSNVRVDQSGILKTDAVTISLYGIALPPRKKICQSSAGTRWTCGNHALMALRNLVDTQTVACVFKNEPKTAVCWVERVDVTRRMLETGWAELAPDVTERVYIDAAASAQKKKVGIWADGPPRGP